MDGETIQRTTAPRAQFQSAQPSQLQQQPVVAPQQQFPYQTSTGPPNNANPIQLQQYQQPVRQAIPPQANAAPAGGNPGVVTSFAGIRQNIPQQANQPQAVRPQPQPQLRRLDSQSTLLNNPPTPTTQPIPQNIQQPPVHTGPYPRPIPPQGQVQQPGVRPPLQPGLVQRPPNYPPGVVPGQPPRPQQPIQVPPNRGQFPPQPQHQLQQQPLQQPRPPFIRQPGVQVPLQGPRPAFVGQPPRPIQAPVRQPGVYQPNSVPPTMASEVAAPPKLVENTQPHLQSGHNDDDDVIMGRMQTPSFSPVPPVQSRPASSNLNSVQNNNPATTFGAIPPATTTFGGSQPATTTFGKMPDNKAPSPQPPQTTFQQPIQRHDSQRSIPSRPPSVLENTKPPEINGMPPKPASTFANPPGLVRVPDAQPKQLPPEPVPAIRSVNPPITGIRSTDSTPPKQLSAQPSVEDTTEYTLGPMNKIAPQMPYKEATRPPAMQQKAAMNQELTKAPVQRDFQRPDVQKSDRESFSNRGKTSILDREAPVRRAPPNSLRRPSNKGDNDSGVDESTQGNERNGPGSPGSPVKSPTKIPGLSRPPSTTPSIKSRSTSKSRLTDKTPDADPQTKKIPMNKVQVGGAPSPNLKAVKSKIGSLENASHKPGGGHVKIENKKIDIRAGSRIAAKNDAYQPGGGDKKIVQNKLQWQARSKIGSLDNAHHKPGGGNKKIETQKLEFQGKSKVGSKDYIKHVPGGGDIKIANEEYDDDDYGSIQTHKLDIKAQSKVGSLDNMKHKPGGGDKKIFDDKEYLKGIDHPITPTPPSQSPDPNEASPFAEDLLSNLE